MKTDSERGGSVTDPRRIVVVSCPYEAQLTDADALLQRYHSLEAWARSVANSGPCQVAVVQRFSRDLTLRRGSVQYHFIADGGGPHPPSWFWGRRIVPAVRALTPTLVHVDGLIFPALVRHLRMALPRGTGILVQDHGGSHDESPVFRSWRRRTFYRWGLRPADGFLFTAHDQVAPWRRARIVSPAQTVYEIPEGSSDFGPAPHGDAGTSAASRLPGRPALLWVGRLDANKDPLTALEAFERAAPALPDAALTMVFGEDHLLPEVRSRIAASPWLRSRVHLRGKLAHEAMPPIYAGADLFVLCSHHEGSGYALIEALAFGLTPVVTDIPSFRALTDQGRLGALFAPGDAAALAAALGHVGAGDLAARRSVVRDYFRSELSWAAVGRRALDIYRTAAPARARVRSARARARVQAQAQAQAQADES